MFKDTCVQDCIYTVLAYKDCDFKQQCCYIDGVEADEVDWI